MANGMHSLTLALFYYVISNIQYIAIYTNNLHSGLVYTQKAIINRKNHQKKITAQC